MSRENAGMTSKGQKFVNWNNWKRTLVHQGIRALIQQNQAKRQIGKYVIKIRQLS